MSRKEKTQTRCYCQVSPQAVCASVYVTLHFHIFMLLSGKSLISQLHILYIINIYVITMSGNCVQNSVKQRGCRCRKFFSTFIFFSLILLFACTHIIGGGGVGVGWQW